MLIDRSLLTTLMVAGGAAGVVYKLPNALWEFAKRKFLVSLDVMDTDPAFDWLTLWLHQHPYSRKSRIVTVSTMATSAAGSPKYDDEDSELPEPRYAPGPGHHLFFYKGRPVWFARWRPDTPSATLSRRLEAFNFRILGRDQGLIRSLVAEARAAAELARRSKLSAYVSSYGNWRKVGDYHPRPLESVVLDRGVKESVVADVERFLASREWYRQMGIPYHRGYLFHGIAGSGKSSLVSALAGHLRLNLYVLNIAGVGMSDERLADLVTEVQPRSLLLLEDVDAATHNRLDGEKEETKGVTLAGLLNALDGVLSTEGYIVVMTSNYPERLDSALTRPGRVDMKVELGHATDYQIREMCRRFGVDRSRLALTSKVTTAQVQQALMGVCDGLSRQESAEVSANCSPVRA